MSKYISVAYQLYMRLRGEDGESLQESRTETEPLVFISGQQKVLPPFEKRIEDIPSGTSFDFEISPGDLFGEYREDMILDLPIASLAGPDGKLDSRLFSEGRVVPMEDGNGGNYMATIKHIGDTSVTVDLNHPHAGASMHFKGLVIENREASDAEVQAFIAATSCGCGGNCGGCGGGCGSDGDCGCGGNCGGCD